MLKIMYLLLTFFFAADSAIAQPRVKAGSKVSLPIHAWIGPPAEHTSYTRYKELSEAGFTHSFSGFPNADAMERALNIAKAAGIKLFIHTPEFKDDPEGTVKRFKDHPALAGYHLRDEPNAKDFPELAAWVKRIRAVDDEHFCYINLFPNYATAEQLGNPSYREHVDEFIRTVPVKVLSFDHYPITESGLRPEWLENLEIISTAARKAGKPFWAFALAVAHKPYPIPSIPQLKLQVYSNLAYGAQGIQYFTYWTPTSTRWDFHDGPIDANGRRTAVYGRVKSVNEEIQKLAWIFSGAKVVSVGHTDLDIPAGTQPFKIISPFNEIDTGDHDAIVSWLENGESKFLMIVNRNFENIMMLHIDMEKDNEVKKVDKSGKITPLGSSIYNCVINPGDAAIFTWEK